MAKNIEIKNITIDDKIYDIVYIRADKMYVVTGCFRGRLDEFIEAVKDTHNQNPFYIEEYMMAIEIAKHRIMRNDHHEIIK